MSPDVNIRSSSYYIAETSAQCMHCGRSTRVFALGLPPGHEMLVEDEWRAVAVDAFIFHVTALTSSVRRELTRFCSSFRPASGTDASTSYWANHCEHCELALSDDELHGEPGGFMPGTPDEAEAILLLAVLQPCSAMAAGHAPDPAFFSSMRQR